MKLRSWKYWDRITRTALLVTGASLLAAGLLMCGGCGKAGSGGTVRREDPVTVLTLASFGANAEIAGQVEAYNRTHADRRIEVKRYQRSEVPEEDGIALLQREIAAGRGPDMIDFGAGYATSDIVGGYTEDLSAFLEAEREKSGAEYFDNILELFRYEGRQLVLPVSFTMRTFVGRCDILGERESWNIADLIDCYENRKNGVILYPGEMKKDVFGTLMHGNLDYYIDWESGSCRFDSEEFAQVLSFADQFSATLSMAEIDSAKQIFLEGGAMLYPQTLSDIYDICRAEAGFGEKDVFYIGYPVDRGRGMVATPAGPMLAISASSAHKEAAWDFLAGFLSEEYQLRIERGFPVRKAALEKRLAENREVEYRSDADGNQVPVARAKLLFEGAAPVEIYNVTEEQAERLLRLIESVDLYSAADYRLYSILLEEAEAYFSGAKSLEETCRVIQGRAAVFVSERVR